MLNASLVPMIANSAYQNELVNRASRSDTITRGTPKSRTTRSKKIRATATESSSPSPSLQGVIRTSLVSRSTHVITALNPLEEGRWVMKSMLQASNLFSGMGNGYN